MRHVKWANCGRVPDYSATSRRSVRYLRAITFAAFILGLFPGRLLADAESDFEMLFGKEAKKVLATTSTADDAAFAKKLLTAATQVADSPGVQVLLYEKAYEFASRHPGAYPTALKAIAYLEKAKPRKIADWQSKKLKVLADAYSQNKGPAKKTPGKLYIDMLIGLAEGKNAKGDLKAALELYRKAFSAAGEVEPSRAESISARVTKLLVVQKHQAEFAGLKTKLAENPKDVKARTELILFCILELDDPKMAASLLAKNVDEKLRKCVPLAAKEVKDLPANACMELADWYYKTAFQEAPYWGKRVALQRAKRYYERFLALHSKKDIARYKAEIALRAISAELPESSPSALTEPAGAGGRRLLLRPRTHSGQELYKGTEQAIRKAIKHLWSQQSQDGTWPSRQSKNYPTGPTALAAYALLACGVNPQEPKMQKTLNWLSKNDSSKTYSLGLRCCVWYLANKKTKGKYLGQLKKDASLLYRSHYDGHYHYNATGRPVRSWCNSNSQYGLLGVWAAAANGGITIPGNYWRAVMKHWITTQGPTGGWEYNRVPVGDAGRPTMVTAGLASLYICHDYSTLPKTPGPAASPIKKGMEWLDKNFAVKSMSWQYYYLYGVARVGQASGRKYFGTKDWYKLGARLLLESQKDEGYWRRSYYTSGGDTTGTAFALLFLVHGRRSVLFNKLKHDGDWNRRDRDIAGLTRALDHVFKSEIDWQIADFGMPMTDWCDGPILYITGTQDPKFTKEQLEKIRTYVQQGGTIFTVVQKGSRQFKSAMQDAYKRLFPKHQLIPAGPGHEVYSNCFDLGKWTDIEILSNGVRPVVIHTGSDLAIGWPSAGGTPPVRNLTVKIAANVAKYATKAETRPRAPTATPSKVSSKWPASRLQLAKGYIKAGMAQKAEVVLKEIISKYPKSEEATEAKNLLKGIGPLEPK